MKRVLADWVRPLQDCSRCTAGCCAPVTGSAPASAVSVLFRSRGASKPARYSRNPRRCATRVKGSSKRAASPSKGPGATGHGGRCVITRPRVRLAPPLPSILSRIQD